MARIDALLALFEEFCFDFSALDGQPLKSEEYKGFRGISLMARTACNLIRNQAFHKEMQTCNKS